MILLGMGMNGHLGLNEPGCSFDLYSHIVDLDETIKLLARNTSVSATYFRYYSGIEIHHGG